MGVSRPVVCRRCGTLPPGLEHRLQPGRVDRHQLLTPEVLSDLAERGAVGTGRGRSRVTPKRVADRRDELLGQDHPDTLTTWANLAVSYRQAGRTPDAIDMLVRVAVDMARTGHPDAPAVAQVLQRWREEQPAQG